MDNAPSLSFIETLVRDSHDLLKNVSNVFTRVTVSCVIWTNGGRRRQSVAI